MGVVLKTKTTKEYAKKPDLHRMLDRGVIKKKIVLLI